MKYSICTYGFIPLRREPAEQAEMVNQLLFGDVYEIIEEEENWSLIRNVDDDYQGWMTNALITPLLQKEVESWMAADKWMASAPFVKVLSEPDKSSHIISGGSSIFFNASDSNSFNIGNKEYYLTGNYSSTKKEERISEIAHSFINAPYLWGGRSFFGIDCSGLVQIVYKLWGMKVPRDASQQVELGQIISFVEEAKAGDLAFFDNDEGKIIHVGICLGGGDIIHASGRVRIDKLDHQGIFNEDKRTYSHKLRVIKRIIE